MKGWWGAWVFLGWGATLMPAPPSCCATSVLVGPYQWWCCGDVSPSCTCCHATAVVHPQVDVALQVWQLVLAGRFRLLDRWCEFVQGRSTDVRVISEDQWRQVRARGCWRSDQGNGQCAVQQCGSSAKMLGGR